MLSHLVEDIAQQLHQIGADAGKPAVKSLINSALQKMDFVSREEFDAQSAVLLRTRMRVQALEKQISELEQQANNA